MTNAIESKCALFSIINEEENKPTSWFHNAQVWRIFKFAENWIFKDFFDKSHSTAVACHLLYPHTNTHTCCSPNSKEIGPCIIKILTQNLHRLLCYLCTGELNILERDYSQFQSNGAESLASLSTLNRREQRMPSSLRREGSQHWHIFLYSLASSKDFSGRVSKLKE